MEGVFQEANKGGDRETRGAAKQVLANDREMRTGKNGTRRNLEVSRNGTDP